jgi:hypothetical protein
MEPTDFEYGERHYSAEDPFRHHIAAERPTECARPPGVIEVTGWL